MWKLLGRILWRAICNFCTFVLTPKQFPATSLCISCSASCSTFSCDSSLTISSSITSISEISVMGESRTGSSLGFSPVKISNVLKQDVCPFLRHVSSLLSEDWLIIKCTQSMICRLLSRDKHYLDVTEFGARNTSLHIRSTVPFAHEQFAKEGRCRMWAVPGRFWNSEAVICRPRPVMSWTILPNDEVHLLEQLIADSLSGLAYCCIHVYELPSSLMTRIYLRSLASTLNMYMKSICFPSSGFVHVRP